MGSHATNNAVDRATGAKWEDCFEELAVDRGYAVMANQRDRSGAAVAVMAERNLVMPDMVVFGRPTQHHEIKHKNPTSYGSYGLEVYRFNDLLRLADETDDLVLYTIHDWQLAGASSSSAPMDNDIHHWVTADVRLLDGQHEATRPGPTYRNGQREIAEIHYWPTELWIPLAEIWTDQLLPA